MKATQASFQQWCSRHYRLEYIVYIGNLLTLWCFMPQGKRDENFQESHLYDVQPQTIEPITLPFSHSNDGNFLLPSLTLKLLEMVSVQS